MSDWNLLGLDGDPAPGDPGRTRTLARHLLDDAELAERNTNRLRDVSSNDSSLRMEGDYAAGFREALGELPGELAKLGRAYRGCGQALSDFAGSLDDAKTRAASALRQGRDAHAAYQGALRDVRSLLPPDRHAAVSGRQGLSEPSVESSTAGLDEGLRSQVRAAAARGRSAEADRARARRLADDAARLRGDAETRCERGIRSALEGIKNKEWYEKAWDFISTPFRSWEDFVNLAKNVAMIAGTVALFISGPIGLALVGIALVAGAVVFADTFDKYRQGKVGLGALAMDALGLFPGARGVISGAKLAVAARGLAGAVRSGGKALPGALRGGPGSLRNGVTDVRTNAVEFPTRTVKQDPVDVATGEVVMRQTDVDLPGVLPLVLTRTHMSSYRSGRWFGPSWASTLDQRLEVDAKAVFHATADGAVLTYPVPPTGEAVLPEEGPRLLLRRTGDGRYTVSDPRSGRTMEFAPAGVSGGTVLPLASVTDRNGNRVDLSYRPDGALAEVRHSGGYRIAVETADGRVTALVLNDDHPIVHFGYSGDGHLAEVVNSSGRPVRFDYDRDGRLTRWEDRNGTWYRYTYDADGRCERGAGVAGCLDSTFTYNPRDRTTAVTNSLGHTSTYHINDVAQVEREVDPLGNATASEWDRYDRLLARTDPLGRTTRYTYDDAGNLTTFTRADGSRATADYNDLRLPVAVTDFAGATWRYEYDERGNRTADTDPLGAITRRTFDDHGAPTTVTDALNNVWRLDNDPAGLALTVTNPTGGTSRFTRDTFGRVTTYTDPLGLATRLVWTVEGKPTRRTLPGGAVERWTYDGEGNVVEHTDVTGAVTRFGYTHFDRPAVRTDPDGATREFAYDTELRLVAVTNPLGLTWRYEHDAAGNLVRESDFDGRVTSYTRDAAGQLASRVNGAGETTRFERDALGNIVEQDSEGALASYDYDASGRLVRARNADADVTFERDALGQILVESCNGRSVASAYDARGRRVRRRTPSGAESAWEYDPVDRPVALRTAGRTLRFGYDAAGREIERRILAGPADTGPVLEQTWDADSLLSSQVLTAPGASDAVRRTFERRADGYLTTVSDADSGARRFDLDPVGRITSVSGDGWAERYAYDPAGSITSAEWSAPTAADEQGAREYAGTRLLRAGSVHYEHDDQGRLTLCGATRYEWNAEDRLAGVTTPEGQRWRYRYDALGRRIAKERLTDDGAGAERVDFVWDGMTLAEQTVADRVTAWTWDPAGFRPVSQTIRRDSPQSEVDEAFYAIVTDLVGAATELVAPDGRIAWRSETTVWGTDASTSVEADCPLRFPGQYRDPETGDHYNYFRYYRPEAGRYHSVDPIGLAGGDDPYRYVLNPSGWSDPLGLMGCGESGGVPVYRVVGPEEAADIAVTGAYRNPAGLEGKYFFPTQAQAENLAGMYGKAGIGGPYTLTSGVVPPGVYNSAEKLAAAGEGPAIFLRTPQLSSVTAVTIHGVLP